MKQRPSVAGASRWGPVGEEYRVALRDLTFNSKPIINNLTFFAQDHAAAASELSQVLGEHLVSVLQLLCRVVRPLTLCSVSSCLSAVVPSRYQITCTLPDRLYLQKYWGSLCWLLH